ncbi:class I SAM-dependent methyltransferase [Jatrophihabitans cynanchi]|uniref:Class I SAM-dependent methyltransferase n=1 Tax=Jatrophihabitans cynanchi TaxID=2944128 RepID=A0ABY7K0S9_9ACTN|nr:class I SAM-dependent methyltransferase [Jatrophihabitans sp. SB3-54]WAX58422.1 class I SAM-dependent methyltransferase [Jatrophihabitans sp. SB3-54]
MSTDLCGSWFADLTAAGFDPGLPTARLEEGVLAYLSPSDATAVLDTITATAVPGSTRAKAAMAPPRPDDETYQRMRVFVGASETPSAGVSGVDRENAYRLADQGWSVVFDNHDDLAAKYGRPNPESSAAAASAQYLTATRL